MSISKSNIVEDWLPRYTGAKLTEFGDYILLTNFSKYLEVFAKKYNTEIKGLDKKTESIIFHCGTIKRSEKVFTNGGRVLAVTSFGKDFKIAISKSYSSIKNIKYKGKIYRKDIGFDL